MSLSTAADNPRSTPLESQPARAAPARWVRSERLIEISLWAIGLMWLLPFLMPFKAPPIPSFHSEALAAALGMLALTALAVFATRLEMPRVALLPLSFAGLILMQLVSGHVGYQHEGVLGALYLLWVAALIVLGGLLRRELGLERVAATLAWFLLCGAVMSAFIGWAQHIDSDALSLIMMPRSPDRVWANLGQANQLGDYLALGLVSAGYLYATDRLKLRWALAVVVALIYVLQLTGSRASLLYLGGLIAISVVFWISARSNVNRRLLGFSLFALVAFFCVPWIVAWITPGSDMGTAAERLRASSLALDERPRIWKAALLMFSESPVLGTGFRQFGWQHFALNGAMPEPRVTGFTDNAHNLPLHVMAEFGLLGLTLLVGLAALWLVRLLRQPRTPAHWWIWSLALVLAVHSMLEYPLWYTFFLGVAAIVLGLGEQDRLKLQLSGRARAAPLTLVAVLAIGWFVLGQLYHDYLILENFLAYRYRYMHATAEVNRQVKAVLLKLHRGSLLAPYVELGLARTISIDPDHLADKLTVNARAMRLFPIEDVVYRQAMLLSLRGDQAAAQRQWYLAIASYPEERELALQVLERRVEDGMNAMQPLLDYARQPAMAVNQ